MKIKYKLVGVFGLIITFMFGMAGAGMYAARALEDSVKAFAAVDIPMLEHLSTMTRTHLQIGSALRDLTSADANTTDDMRKMSREYLADLLAEFKTAKLTLAGIAMDDEDRELLKQIESIEGPVTRAAEASMKAQAGGDITGAREAAQRSLQQRKTLTANMKKLVAHKVSEVDDGIAESKRIYRQMTWMMVVMLSVATAIAAIGAWLVVRDLTRSLALAAAAADRMAAGDFSEKVDAGRRKDEVGSMLNSMESMRARLSGLLHEVNGQSDAVATLANDLAVRAEQAAGRSQVQSDRIMEISAAMEEMTVTIAEVSEGARGVNCASLQTRGSSQDGAAQVQNNLAVVDKIVEAVEGSSDAINELGKATVEIGQLAGMIKEIADRTNLLALNAAIEAARAGDAGRGFAVVADEVRKLADQSNGSSESIQKLVESINRKTEQAVVSMQKVNADVRVGAEQSRAIAGKLIEISTAAQHVTELTEQIASATHQQSSASAQTAQSMQEISSITEQNNAVIQTVTVGAKEMTTTAEALKGLVAQFRLTAA